MYSSFKCMHSLVNTVLKLFMNNQMDRQMTDSDLCILRTMCPPDFSCLLLECPGSWNLLHEQDWTSTFEQKETIINLYLICRGMRVLQRHVGRLNIIMIINIKSCTQAISSNGKYMSGSDHIQYFPPKHWNQIILSHL